MISLIYTNFVRSDEAELGSAGEQPNRNNLTDWNGQGEFNSPLFQNHSYHYAFKNSNIFFYKKVKYDLSVSQNIICIYKTKLKNKFGF